MAAIPSKLCLLLSSESKTPPYRQHFLQIAPFQSRIFFNFLQKITQILSYSTRNCRVRGRITTESS